MEDLFQLDPAIFGTFGGPREYGEASGRFNGGGWIEGPMAATDEDGKGIWAQPPESDGERNLNDPGRAQMFGSYGKQPLLDEVMAAEERSLRDGGWF